MNRRSWLAGAASLLGASAGSTSGSLGCSENVNSKATVVRASSSRRVLVLGAGLAGLATAHELVKDGFHVTVLEAQERAGGRILTLREPFTNGAFVEAGAMHVGSDPDLLSLVETAGVTLERPKSPHDLATLSFLDGQRVRRAAGEDPPSQPAFSAEEIALGFIGRLKKYFGSVTSFDPEGPWPPAALARHDVQNGVELMTELGASPAYVRDFGRAMLGEPIDRVSGAFVLREMAGFFRDYTRDMQSPAGGRVVGGMDRFPKALAAQLGARVWYGAEVKRITLGAERGLSSGRGSGARVSFVRRGAIEHLDAERIVCAIPFTVLRHVEIAPGLSPLKRRAVNELRMVSTARLFAQLDRRFWVERGESGDADTDLPTGKVRDETKRDAVLGAYVSGDAARRLTALPEAERMRTFLDAVEKVHPGAAEHLLSRNTASHYWDEDPFARGAHAWFAPGQMTTFGEALWSAEGCVHFAGDHTSYRPGWMHGAVASAKRAAGEVRTLR